MLLLKENTATFQKLGTEKEMGQALRPLGDKHNNNNNNNDNNDDHHHHDNDNHTNTHTNN